MSESGSSKRKKEMKRMSRSELVDIISTLQNQTVELQAQNDTLTGQVAALEAEKQNRTICLQKAGSIAEASLQLNAVFEAAQQAADDYIASVMEAFTNPDGSTLQDQADEILARTQKQGEAQAAQITAKARQQAEQEAESVRAGILQQAEEEAAATRSQAEEDVARMQEEFYAEVRDALQKHPEISRHMRKK